MTQGTQSIKNSFIESVVNQVVSFVVALTGQLLIFPLFGIVIDMKSHIFIALIFGMIMIVKSFIVRRIFNKYFN